MMHIYIQHAEERFLEASNILSFPNASFLLKIHQASSDHIGSVLWGFLEMLCISVSRAIAHTPVQLNICHKQSVSTEKLEHCWFDEKTVVHSSHIIWNCFVFCLLGFAIWVYLGGRCLCVPFFFTFKTHQLGGYQEHNCCKKDIRSTVCYYITRDLADAPSASSH